LTKIFSLYTILFILLFTACGDDNSDTRVVPPQITSFISDEEIRSSQAYSEKNLAHRATSFQLYEEVKEKETLSGADLDALHKMLVSYLENVDDSDWYATKYEYLVYERDGYSQEERLKLIMISLSSMLIEYDNYIISYSKYYDDSKLRAILNDADTAYDIPSETLNAITDAYTLESNRRKLEIFIEYYEDDIDNYSTNSDPFFLYLKQLIEDSPTYKYGFTSVSPLNTLEDIIKEFFASLYNGVSTGIGNTAGLVEIRTGKLYEDDAIIQRVSQNLQVGDILVERTPFRLTDKLIPGYWGHIAVYVGTQSELEALGIWDEPSVVAYHEAILEGKVIIEALRDGVQLNSVAHFLNIDDLAIMNNDTESLESKRARVLRTFNQLGKEYDFEYDIESSERIICSELVYITYLEIDWETESLVGVSTISPDNVVNKLFEVNSIFDVSVLYIDGEEINENKLEVIRVILEEESEFF